MTLIKTVSLFTICLCWASASASAAPVGSAFSYQGVVDDNGRPADGVYDVQFRLFDAVTGGLEIAPTVAREDIRIEAGLLATTLDFGASAFAGQARWLELALRAGTSTAAFTVLTPRQPLLPAPYALYALTPAGPKGDRGDPGPQGAPGPQGPAGTSPWAVSTRDPRDIYFDTGSVGIGTVAPTAKLDVRGSVFVQDTMVMAAADAPMITRGWDLFTSGPKTGLGRWGLFMEPGSLVIGIPSVRDRSFQVARYEPDGSRVPLMTVAQEGGVTISGTLSQGSDRNQKENIQGIDPRALLEKVISLPISQWTYKENPDIAHIGPMAQDFKAAFGLGADDRHIAVIDADGVALAALQGLHAIVTQKERQISALEDQNEALTKRLQKLEEQVEQLARQAAGGRK